MISYNNFNLRDIIVATSAFFVFLLIFFAVSRIGILALLAPLLIIVLYLLILVPEVAFALFLNAGIYKADSRLNFLPEFLDLTVCFGIISIIALLFGIIRKKIKFFLPPKKLLLPYLCIVVLAVTSIVYTLAPIYGTHKLLKFLTMTSFALFGPLFLFQNEHSIKRFFMMYVLLSALMAVDVFWGEGVKYYRTTRFYQAFSSGQSGLAMVTAETILILIFYFLFTTKTKLSKLFIISLIFPTFFACLISGARGSVFILGILFLIILVYYTIGDFVRRAPFLNKVHTENKKILITLIIILCVLVYFTIHFQVYFSTFFRRTSLLLSNVEEYESVRLYQNKKAVEALLSFPSGLIGLGIGGFSMFGHGSDRKRGAFVHNIFLDIGSELGIFGLMSFSLLIYWSITTAFGILRRVRGNQYFMGITLLLLFSFMLIFASSVNGEINDCRSLFTWIGSIYAYKRLISRKGFKKVTESNIIQ